MVNEKKPDAAAFYGCLEQAFEKAITPGNSLNAAQHVWGYLDKLASSSESRRVLTDIEALDKDTKSLPRLKNKLLVLAKKHRQDYLLRSLSFYL